MSQDCDDDDNGSVTHPTGQSVLCQITIHASLLSGCGMGWP